MIVCHECKGQRTTWDKIEWQVCPVCRGEGLVDKPVADPINKVEPEGDANVSFLQSGEATPLHIATKVLARVKEVDVMSLVAYMTVATPGQGVGIVPYCSNVGLAEMSMISATANGMTQAMLMAGVVTAPAPEPKTTA